MMQKHVSGAGGGGGGGGGGNNAVGPLKGRKFLRGGVLAHISHIGMCRPKKVWFLLLFRSEIGYRFCPF